jgi:hypothetical protein
VAVVFWLHAIGLTHVVRVRFGDALSRVGSISEIALLTLIFFYSYLASNGWWSLLFDVGYVYLFPLWMFAKYSWKLTKTTAQRASKVLPKSAIVIPPAVQEPAKSNPGKAAESNQSRDSLARPFQQFALLWCGVILLSHETVLTVIGVGVILVAIGKATYLMSGFLNGSMEWLSKSQARLEEMLTKTVDQALGQDPGSKEFRSSITSIRIYETLLRWLGDRDGIERWIQGATLSVIIPYYLYISILSGFVYLGLAHLYGYTWPAREAIIDALFVPFAWTDLPHIMSIRLLAGIQSTILAIVGYEAIFRRISHKADRIAKAAEQLSRKLANPNLQSKILIISQSPSTPTATNTDGQRNPIIQPENNTNGFAATVDGESRNV